MKITPNNQDATRQQDIYIDEFNFNKFKGVYDNDVDDIRWYNEKCARNKDIRKYTDRNFYMTASKAVELGIIDKVLTGEPEEEDETEE